MREVKVVGAVIQNARGEILCAQRAAGRAQAGLWEFPGGKIEPGETPAESLRREIAEELGCEITVGERVAEVAHPYPDLLVRLVTYKAQISRGKPKAREHAQLRWVAVAHLTSLDWAPADIPTVQQLQDHRSTGFSG